MASAANQYGFQHRRLKVKASHRVISAANQKMMRRDEMQVERRVEGLGSNVHRILCTFGSIAADCGHESRAEVNAAYPVIPLICHIDEMRGWIQGDGRRTVQPTNVQGPIQVSSLSTACDLVLRVLCVINHENLVRLGVCHDASVDIY